MRDYELVTVVSPEVGDEGFPATVDRVHQFIQERGGAITKDDRWGRRRLAYPIRRLTEAFYSVTHFSLDPQSVRALEGSLDLAEDVLRHLVVRLDEIPEPKADVSALEPVAEVPAAAPEGDVPTAEVTLPEPEAEVAATEPEAEASAESPAEETAEE